VWVDLAERLGLRLLSPRPAPLPLLELRFERLAAATPAAGEADGDVTERYGAGSAFARIAKGEDPGFVIDLAEALERIPLPAAPRLLDLGVNTGDELALLEALSPALATAAVVGVDHSATALAVALAGLAGLDLGRFDLVVSIGTLQSGGLDDRALLRTVVQDHLAPGGSLILGLPNCRYRDGELVHGARMKNYRQAELGLLVKDVAFYRKYLQQHHRRVYVTGKHYLFVTAVPEASPAPARP
jgi:SAM-dependent methyltransferase